MESLNISYGTLSQIAQYFKSLESVGDLPFSTRRRLIRLNEELTKDLKIFQSEINNIAEEHSEKDESGNFILLEGGGQKIKEGDLDIVNKKLMELSSTEAEISYQPFKIPEKYFEGLKCDAQTVKFIEDNFLEE